jgi:gliding motility-associated-like protein
MNNNNKKFVIMNIKYLIIKTLPVFSLLLFLNSYGQNNTLILNGGYAIMNGGTAGTPVYLVVNQPDTAGIVRISGHIATENQYHYVKWVTGTNSGNYIFPFGVSNNASDYIPFTFNKTVNTNNEITVSTWGTNPQNMPHAAATNVGPVTQMTGFADSVVAAIDRFWDITASNAVTANLTFSYLGSENTTAFPNDTIKAQHWNGTSWDPQAGPGNLGVTSGVGTVGPIPNQTTFSPWILTVIPNCTDAEFTYNSPFCENDTTTVLPTILPGSAAGIFSSSSSNISLNSTTGQIDLTNSSAGTYMIYNTVAATNTCPQKVDSFEITIYPVATSQANVAICQGDSVYVGGSYQNTAGTYFDTLSTVNGCDSIIFTTVTVNPVPQQISFTDTTLCFVDLPVNYYSSTTDTLYWYSDAQGNNLIFTSNSFTPSISGGGVFTYYYQSMSNGCSNQMDSVTVTVYNPIASINASPTSGVIPLDVDFSTTTNSNYTYSWNLGDGTTDNNATVSHTYDSLGNYLVTLTVTEGFCSATDTITIEVFGESVLVVPNIFTPNNDGVNDVFRVESENLSSLTGTIWNRWGELIFQLENEKSYWDGRNSAGVEVPDGTYFYVINAKGIDGKEYELKGSVTIVR